MIMYYYDYVFMVNSYTPCPCLWFMQTDYNPYHHRPCFPHEDLRHYY